LPSTLKMEAKYSSETSVHLQETEWRYDSEDTAFHNHRCEHLKHSNESVDIRVESRVSWACLNPVYCSILLSSHCDWLKVVSKWW
jgi:hypothetical protein